MSNIVKIFMFIAIEGVVSVFPNTIVPLHTTRSWDFLDFPESHPISATEGDVIIGMLDTGNLTTSFRFVLENLSKKT